MKPSNLYRAAGTFVLGSLAVGFFGGCDAQTGLLAAGAMASGAADGMNAHYGHPSNYGEQYLQAVQASQDSAATPTSTDDGQ